MFPITPIPNPKNRTAYSVISKMWTLFKDVMWTLPLHIKNRTVVANVKGWDMVVMRSGPEWGELQTATNISDE